MPKLEVKIYLVEEAAKLYPELLVDDDYNGQGFYVLHEQEWVDYWPEYVVLIIETETQEVIYSLPGQEWLVKKYGDI